MSLLSCDNALEQLNSALDGEELGAVVEQSLASHLDGCPACARAARELSSMHRLMLELQVQQLDAKKTQSARAVKVSERRRGSSRFRMRSAQRSSRDDSNVWRIAAASAAALVLFVFFLNSQKSNNDVAQPKVSKHPVFDAAANAEKRRAAQEEFARADLQRKRALSQLVELERNRNRIEKPASATLQPTEKTSAEEKERLEALARLDSARREAETELQRAREAQDRAHEEIARVDSAVPNAAPTVASVVQPLGQITGLGSNIDAYIERNGNHVTLSPGETILPNDRVVIGKGATTGEAGVSLALINGASVFLAAETAFEITSAESSRLISGKMFADVAKDHSGIAPKGYRWVVKTRAADVGITGTRFFVGASETQTQLRMEEGSVDYFNAQGKQRVTALQECIANVGAAPNAPTTIALGDIWRGRNDSIRATATEEIVLSAAQSRLIGEDWQYVRDEQCTAKLALECPKSQTRGERDTARDITRLNSYAMFKFKADANKDYYLWIRGNAPAVKESFRHDAVIAMIPESTLNEPEGPYKGNAGRGDAALFNGFSFEQGYWWVGGDSDRAGEQPPPDTTPVVVRFNKSGEQLLKLYAVETPIRIDCIWISATQKARPGAAQHGPLKPAK